MERPLFDVEDTVKLRRTIRNDGTFPGVEKGDILVDKEEEGMVIDLGTFLMDLWIYSVQFGDGKIVGCKGSELELVKRGRYYRENY